MQQQDHDIVITTEQVEALKESIESPVEVLEGNQTVEQLDQTFAQAAGRGYIADIIHVDESPFVPEEQIKGDESYALKCDDNLVIGDSMQVMAANTGAVEPIQIVDHAFTAKQVNDRIGAPEEEAALDESFALPGDDEVIDENHPAWPVGQECYPKEVQVLPRSMGKTTTFEEDKQALRDQIGDIQEKLDTDVEKTTEKRAAIIGAGASSMAGLLTAQANEHFEASQEDTTKVKSTPLTSETKSQRKKRLAAEHNAQINGNKLAIVKLRTIGLSVLIEVLEMSNREVNLSKERGTFVVYTTKSAVSATRLCYLPYAQHHKQTTINAITLDWLLDQIGETEAFEIRSGRLRPSTPLKYTVTKTQEEWLAKGFMIVNGEVRFGGNWPVEA